MAPKQSHVLLKVPTNMNNVTMDPQEAQSLSQDVTPCGSAENLDVEAIEDEASEDSDDIDKMLSELQGFQEELEQETQNVFDDQTADFAISTPTPKPLDEFRFSMTAMEDTGEVDLDALLEDLCIMEKDLNSNTSTTNSTEPSFFDENSFYQKPNSPLSPKIKVPADVRDRLESVQEENKELTLEVQQERIKAEKIRIALEKLRAARVKKLVVKVYNDDDPTSKTIAIDQTWTSWEVCKKMMRKNDAEPDPNWVLLERLPELCIERALEDHESVVDIVSFWPWEHENRLVINNKRDKYALFRNPQNYLLSSDTSAGAAQLAEKSKDILLEEYFQRDAMRLPDLDGVLYLKEGKKSWKKHYFVLRASGIYYTPKGKTKSSKDLVCLVKFEYVALYSGGAQFRKKFKAPTDHCFVLKHPEYHDIDSKAIKYFCADDQKTLQRWAVCIRLAKYGYRMLEDYATTQDEMDRLAFTLDKNRFPKAASFSAGQNGSEDTTVPQITDARDKAIKSAKAQSEKIKMAMGPNYSGSQSFSVSRKQSTEKRQQKKNIGNLFSDAWKKGTEPEEETWDPGSPVSPTSTGSGMTPNSVEPKSFIIDNEVMMDEIAEEAPHLPPPPPSKLDEDIPSPLSSKNSSNSNSLERNNIENAKNTPEQTRIPSPTEVKSMLETLHSPPPSLACKGVSMLPHSAPAPAQSTAPPPSPFFNFAPAPAPAPPMARNESPRSPSGSFVAAQPSSSPSNRSFTGSPRSPHAVALSSSDPPLPPPPVARKPSRSNSVLSQKSIDEGLPMAIDDPVNDDFADFPPPPPLPQNNSVPPPVKRKPSRSGSMNGNGIGNVNKKITRVAEMGSTDSLDNIPPPPPLDMAMDSSVDLPPPPPDVLFKSQLESSLMRSNSESRERANSNGKPTPPPPPPKTGRPRLTSNGKGPLH